MKKTIMLSLVAIFSSLLATADQTNEHLKPYGLISQEEAVTLQNTYIKWQQENLFYTYRSGMSGMPIEFTFELDRLKQYIAYVEAEAKRLGHTDLALRVYLAAYPPGYKDNGNAETTIFFAPAAKDTGGGVNDKIDTGGNGQDSYHTIDTIEPLNNGHGGSGGYPLP